jgi:endonuclease YncB( thermonuclease family)
VRRARRSVLAALALLAGAALAVWLAPGEEVIVGRATAMDGDSLRVDGVEIRLEGIDAPELAQLCERNGEPWRCGREARTVLAEALRGEIVTCRVASRDRYRRRLARCEAKGRDIGGLLVSEGWALAYGAYEREERRARRARSGLWSGRFERPSDWRKAE